MTTRTMKFVLALFASTALLAAACGDDDTTDTTDTTEADGATDDGATDDGATDDGATDDEGAAGDTIEVVGVDYAFEGIPETVEAGTSFSFSNEGEDLHELVVFRIPDDEERSVEELVQLPQEEFEAIGGETPPVFVSMAEPGQDGQVVFPEGAEATVTEPGRYAAFCFIPVGMQEMPDEEEMEGPPEGDGPPHYTEGMHAEFTVE